VGTQGSTLVLTTGQSQLAASSQPLSASGWLPGFQDNSILNKPGEQQTSEVSANSEQLLASNPQASPYFSPLAAWARDMNAPQTASTPQANSLQGLQASPSPTLPWDPSDQNSSGSGLPAQASLEASNPSTQAGNGDSPEREEVANLLAKFAGAEVTLKYQSSGPTTVSPSAASDTGMGGLHAASVSSLPNAATPKTENTVVVTPANGGFHPAQGSNSPANEVSGQKANGVEATGLHDFFSPATVLSQRPDANSPPATPAASQRKDTTTADNGVQPTTPAPASTGESAAYTNLSDSSTNGQEREQTGPSAGDNPTGVRFISSNVTANTAPASATNLLTVQTSQVPVSHADNLTAQTSASPSQPPTTLSAWQNYEAGALVRSAWLSDSARGAEMRVELRSGELGPLEVRASIHDGSVGAEIHVEDHEAHTLLAAGLPSLERAMGERNLRVENIAVYQDRAGGEMTGGDNQNPYSGSSASPQPQVLPGSNTPQPSSTEQYSSDVEELASTGGGLSVRA
jgi:flagellar hook-length control protein FliK